MNIKKTLASFFLVLFLFSSSITCQKAIPTPTPQAAQQPQQAQLRAVETGRIATANTGKVRVRITAESQRGFD